MAATDGGIDGNTWNGLKTHDDSIQTLKFTVLHRNRFDTATGSGPMSPLPRRCPFRLPPPRRLRPGSPADSRLPYARRAIRIGL